MVGDQLKHGRKYYKLSIAIKSYVWVNHGASKWCCKVKVATQNHRKIRKKTSPALFSRKVEGISAVILVGAMLMPLLTAKQRRIPG